MDLVTAGVVAGAILLGWMMGKTKDSVDEPLVKVVPPEERGTTYRKP